MKRRDLAIEGAVIFSKSVSCSNRCTAACCATTFASATATAAVRASKVSRSLSPCCALDHPWATRRDVRWLVTRPNRRWPAPGGPPLRVAGVAPRLHKLLIEIRRGNHGEDIPLVNLAADIDVADANIAGGPGIERCAVECRHTARQIDGARFANPPAPRACAQPALKYCALPARQRRRRHAYSG